MAVIGSLFTVVELMLPPGHHGGLAPRPGEAKIWYIVMGAAMVVVGPILALYREQLAHRLHQFRSRLRYVGDSRVRTEQDRLLFGIAGPVLARFTHDH